MKTFISEKCKMAEFPKLVEFDDAIILLKTRAKESVYVVTLNFR